ncbi:hypothetical protein A3K63_03995 [Candidatus Micrarchaeota archaeon RBG_16_49_10]|nr:MAG: hypothetical protein A3K63_03995 [Candidatus Micrarchaeota archaeon RBG_16_49_10]
MEGLRGSIHAIILMKFMTIVLEKDVTKRRGSVVTPMRKYTRNVKEMIFIGLTVVICQEISQRTANWVVVMGKRTVLLKASALERTKIVTHMIITSG